MAERRKKKNALFIASTKQHIGKTTLSLGIFAGMQTQFTSPTYMKPVGQSQVVLKEGLCVDKDVLLFKNHFHLVSSYENMSPVLVPPGFTRDFLDHKTSLKELVEKLKKTHRKLKQESDFIVIEGTGHCGVGSILELNNAQVAHMFSAPLILIASGGLGASFDELCLNKALCDAYKVPILGVILNKVRPEKFDMIRYYMSKALSRWKIPLLGCIPEDSLLSQPTCYDFQTLFHTSLLSGKTHLMRHFTTLRLIASSLDTYQEPLVQSQLLITPAHREEILEAILTRYWKEKSKRPEDPLKLGLILTGEKPPRLSLIDSLIEADIPMLYTPLHSGHVMEIIHTSTVKIQVEDTEKIGEAIDLVKAHIDFEMLLERLKKIAPQ